MADMNKYRFSSKEWEGSAGIYYYGYRFYDPDLQRWVNRDPLGDRGGLLLGAGRVELGLQTSISAISYVPYEILARGFEDPINVFAEISLNPFRFADNNPICSIDPDGNLSAKGIMSGIGVAILAYEALEAACHAQKAADDAWWSNAKRCLASGEMPTVPKEGDSGFRKFCVSCGLYK